MEKSILKTLHYFELYNYPLKAWEIHKWLISQKATFKEIDEALERLLSQKKIKNIKGYYQLSSKEKTIPQGLSKFKSKIKFHQKARFVASCLKIVPWIKLVGVSGKLAAHNLRQSSVIKLTLIVSKNSLWISRLLTLLMLELLNVRYKSSQTKKYNGGRVVVGTILQEDLLKRPYQDIFSAHELLEMQVLWQRENIYSRLLEKNTWVFEFFPNWLGGFSAGTKKSRQSNVCSWQFLTVWINFIAKLFQRQTVKKFSQPNECSLYFHPPEFNQKVLRVYYRKIKRLERLK